MTLRNPTGEQVESTYDALGRIAHTRFFDDRTERYRYDTNGRLVQLITGLGERTQFEHGPTSKVLRKIDPDESETVYDYTPEGRVLSAANQDISVSFAYNDQGKCVTEVQRATILGFE